jgi:hypothetical protein
MAQSFVRLKDLARDKSYKRKYGVDFQVVHRRGPKVYPLLSVGACNICVGFANVTHIRRESRYVTQMLSAKFAYDVRHAARVSCKCCTHLSREERAARDVTYGPHGSLSAVIMVVAKSLINSPDQRD